MIRTVMLIQSSLIEKIHRYVVAFRLLLAGVRPVGYS